MSGLTHNVSTQADELLDHIYEYGTNSEGVIHRINRLCDAAVEQLRAELAASREREARMQRDAISEIEAMRSLARDAYDAWDHDRDAKVGKLLRAIMDDDFRAMYRPDLAVPNAPLEAGAEAGEARCSGSPRSGC